MNAAGSPAGGDHTGGRRFKNNFDLLRFSAAASIIISHSFALTLGYSQISIYDPSLLFGQAGLAALLVISGYLIMRSWQSEPEIVRFFWKRMLRLIPGLLAAIIFTLFVIGPLATSLSLFEYLQALLSPSAWTGLPFYGNGAALGLFTSNPVPFVNAPLWAIPFEVCFYTLIALLGVAGILQKRGVLLSLILLNAGLWLYWLDDPQMNKIRFGLYFLIGAMYALHRPDDHFSARTAVVYALILAAATATLSPLLYIAAFAAIPYLVLYLAYLPTPRLHRFGKYGDFSYGLFIFSYPVMQAAISLWPEAPSIAGVCAAGFFGGLTMAVISWNLIEKKTLRFKSFSFKRSDDL